jgi:hypothetical protein
MSSNYLSLSQRTGGRRVGGSMSVGSENASVREFQQPFNVSSGAGLKVRKTKKVKGGSMVEGVEPKTRKPRVQSKYNAFVKANYPKSVHLPPKQRLGFIAKMWREMK